MFVFRVNVVFAHVDVVLWSMVFGEVVRQIEIGGCPVNVILSLFDSVLDPVESHVDGSGSSLFDVFVGKACCHGVVELDRCRRLWVAHLFQSGS